MIRSHVFSLLFSLASLASAFANPVMAQEATGTPGAPDATITIDGRYLPSPPAPFGGQIGLSAKDSKPYWQPQVVPPKGAPNILLIMTDDAGYGVSSTFGGVIPTPALDRVAQMGLRYTQFHSTALCSPTRAALITGRNHHSVGYGVVSEQATGYPGYDSVIGVAAIASNGTTVRDYRTGTGESGNFPLELLVYGREGEPCVRCGTRLTGTHLIDARISVFCHRCQS